MLKVGHNGKVKLDEDSGHNCSLKAQSFSYFRCDGTPKVIRAGTTFKLSLKDNDYLLLEVINTTSFDSITGRIIKLTINCNNGKKTKSFVLLFKYEGSFNCKFKLIFCISRTLKVFFYPLLFSKSITVTQGSSSTSQVPSTIPFTSSVVTDLLRTQKRSTTSDSPSKDPVVARRDPGHERGTEGKSSPVALIAGVTVAILVILIIIAVLVYRRRHSGDNSNSGKKAKRKGYKTAMSSLDGITLDTLGNEDHYKALTLREPAVYESVRKNEKMIMAKDISTLL
ncbi:unnamed protein product [Pocillopora meandrina]|uniref:Uncharacterized protein n=1 Tax=Pocillopora meandrina TaxID=46732 RepID=A0AAU9WEU6_9CNID|nr:unnamed protein product [Pocillopora meandrina]